jgi:hypothetical protein
MQRAFLDDFQQARFLKERTYETKRSFNRWYHVCRGLREQWALLDR